MSTAYYYNFCSIILKRNDRKIVKEIFIGILVSVLLMMVYQLEVLWGNLVVLFYCFLIHITCMVENETFFSYQDLEMFHMNGNRLPFKITYVLQRILLDMFVANMTIVTIVFLYLSITTEWTTALFFLTIIIMSQCVMPSYNYWAYKVGEQGVIASVVVLIIALIGLIVGCIHDLYPLRWLFSGSSYLNSFLLILLTTLYIFILDFMGRHYKNKQASIVNTRFFFTWLKPINVFLFKDYVLFYQNILLNLIMILTLYSLLILGTEERLIPFMVAFIVGSSSIFAMKSKKKYTILSNDPLFAESIITKDVQFIRLTKLKTILTGSVIKTILGYWFLYYHGISDFMIFASLLYILILGSIVEFIVIYKNRLASSIMNKFLVYTAVVLFGISAYFDSYYDLLWIYFFVLAIHCVYLTVGILIKREESTI